MFSAFIRAEYSYLVKAVHCFPFVLLSHCSVSPVPICFCWNWTTKTPERKESDGDPNFLFAVQIWVTVFWNRDTKAIQTLVQKVLRFGWAHPFHIAAGSFRFICWRSQWDSVCFWPCGRLTLPIRAEDAEEKKIALCGENTITSLCLQTVIVTALRFQNNASLTFNWCLNFMLTILIDKLSTNNRCFLAL